MSAQEPSSPPALGYKYFAFISYSRKDSRAAAWLQKRLEWFRFPVKLVQENRRPPHDRYVRPIYRDKTNLEVTDEHYWTNIRRALEESRYLIILCSEHSAKSQPVNMEVEHFLKAHNNDTSRLAPIIVSGNVTSEGEDTALCPAMHAVRDPDDKPLIDRNLPTMVPDATAAEPDAWEQGFVSLISYLLKLERTAIGDHIQRETKHQASVLRRWLAAVILLTLCTIAGGVYSLIQKAKQEALLLSASYAAHEAAIKAFDNRREQEGIAYFERALHYAPKNTSALAAAVQHSVGMNAPKWRTRSVAVFENGVTCIAFSPDGRYLAAGSRDNTARVIEAATGKEISKAEFGNRVTSVSFSPDCRYFAAGSDDNTVRVIETATGKVISKAKLGNRVTSVIFSPDGRYLAAGSEDKTARVIEAKTGKEITKAQFGDRVWSVSFSPDGCHLAAGSGDLFDNKGEARVIEAATGKETCRAEFGGSVNSVIFSPDGRYLAAGSGDILGKGEARVIEVATGKVISKAEFGNRVTSVIFSPDGRCLGAGSWDKTARVIEAATGKEISKAEFGSYVISVGFSPDGRYLAAGSEDKIAQVIEANTGKVTSKVEFGGEVTSVTFNSDGRYLAAGSEDKTARVIEATTGKEIGKAEFGSKVNSVSFSPDGLYLVVGSGDPFQKGEAQVIEAATGKEISKAEFGNRVTSVGFSPDGLYLAVGSGDSFDNKGEARVIKAATGQQISKAEFGNGVNSVSFSPDGCHLAAGSEDKTARVIEAATGKEISKAEFGDRVTSVSFSPDGRYLAAGSWDKVARVIEAKTGKVTSKVEFGGEVTSVTFSSDGRCLAAGSWDKTARVIEATTGKEISKAGFGNGVNSVSFSPDGRYLVAGSGNIIGSKGEAQVLEAAMGKEICKAEFGQPVTSVSLSADGRYLAAGSGDNTARVIEAGWHKADPAIHSAFAQALSLTAGVHFQTDGRLAPLTAAELTQAQAAVTAFIEAPAPSGAKSQHALLTWAAMMPETRTTSPWTTELLRVAAGRWFMQASGKVASFITDTADEAPWHPLEPISLARLEPKPEDKTDATTRETLLIRPRFLARLTLKRLREADEKLYGRETLAQYAAWTARIIADEIPKEDDAHSRMLAAKDSARRIANLLNAAIAAGVEADNWKKAAPDLVSVARVGVSAKSGAFAGTVFQFRNIDDKQSSDAAVYLNWDDTNHNVVYSDKGRDESRFVSHGHPEALEAINFALERTPPEKQKELLELKAKLEAK